MSKYKPPYPPESRAGAIRLARTSGKPHGARGAFQRKVDEALERA